MKSLTCNRESFARVTVNVCIMMHICTNHKLNLFYVFAIRILFTLLIWKSHFHYTYIYMSSFRLTFSRNQFSCLLVPYPWYTWSTLRGRDVQWHMIGIGMNHENTYINCVLHLSTCSHLLSKTSTAVNGGTFSDERIQKVKNSGLFYSCMCYIRGKLCSGKQKVSWGNTTYKDYCLLKFYSENITISGKTIIDSLILYFIYDWICLCLCAFRAFLLWNHLI